MSNMDPLVRSTEQSEKTLIRSGEDLKRIAMFGLFRSGTNFLRSLLEWNYKCAVQQNAYGWKHGFYPIIAQRSEFNFEPLDLVYVTRNPFLALSSLHSYYSKNGRNIIATPTLKGFIRNRMIVYDSGAPNSPQYRFKTPIEYWNDLNWNLSSVSRPALQQIQVRYEDIMRTPVQRLEELSAQLGLTRTTEELMVPRERVKNMPPAQKLNRDFYFTNRVFDSTEFAKDLYMHNFEPDDIEFILENLDHELVFRLGYNEEIERLCQANHTRA